MIPVGISSRKKLTKGQIRKFKRKGLKWNGYEYYGVIDKRTLKRLQYYCEKNKIKFKVKNDFGERRYDYRSTFFKSYPPVIGDKYMCAYCGKLLNKDEVTVDHLYPVARVNESIRLQRKLIKRGILNVNDKRNLVSACEICNKKKGKKLGKWILRGKIGRYKWLWVIRFVIRAVLFIIAIILGFLIVTGRLSI